MRDSFFLSLEAFKSALYNSGDLNMAICLSVWQLWSAFRKIHSLCGIELKLIDEKRHFPDLCESRCGHMTNIHQCNVSRSDVCAMLEPWLLWNRCASSVILLFPSIGWMLMKVVNEGMAKPPNGMIMDTQVITCKRPLYPPWVSVRASYKCLLYLNHYRYGSQTRVATQSKVLHGRVIQCENQSRSVISLKVTSSLKTLNSSLTL